MKCPFCKIDQTAVKGGKQRGRLYIRYRRCLVCGKNFVTREFVVEEKKDGLRNVSIQTP